MREPSAKSLAADIRDALSEAMGIDAEQFERLSAIIAAHMYADRMLTFVLTIRLARARNLTDPEMNRLLEAIADLQAQPKMALAEALNIFTEPTLGTLRRLTRIRNA